MVRQQCLHVREPVYGKLGKKKFLAETTTTTTKVPNSTQPAPAGNVGTDVLLLGESAAGSGLIGNSPETDIFPPGFSDGSGFIGGAGGGDNGLAFGAEVNLKKDEFGDNFSNSVGNTATRFQGGIRAQWF